MRKADYSPKIRLYPREKEVLILMSQGFSNNAIGEQLGIRVVMVKNYYRQARQKIIPIGETWSKEQVLAYAEEHKLLDP